MSLKIVQMFLRGATLIMMLVAFYLNSESDHLIAIGQFIKSGVYGSYCVITMGLLCEVGLQINSDACIETAFLLGGALMNLICASITFTDFQKHHRLASLDMGLLSLLSFIIYTVDFLLLLFLKKKI